MKNKTVWRVVFLLLTVLHCYLIFRLSAAPMAVSLDMSGSVTDLVTEENIIIDFESLTEFDRQALLEQLGYLVRKAAHVVEFAILGWLLAVDTWLWFQEPKSKAAGRKREKAADPDICWPWRYTILPCMCGILYAISDEWHQTFVEGRTGKWPDVVLDSTGVLVGVFCAVFMIRFFNRWLAQRQ